MVDPKKTMRQMQAEQTKLQIFDAAMGLLKKQDFDSITVRDIVREAQVSVGSFYHAYPSKLDVFYETYQIADRYFETVVRPQLQQPTVQERILFFFCQYAAYNQEISLFALTKVLYNANNKCFHRAGSQGMTAILEDLIQQGKESDELHTQLSAADAAQFFMVCIRGVVYDWCTCDGEYDLGARIRQYVLLLMQTL